MKDHTNFCHWKSKVEQLLTENKRLKTELNMYKNHPLARKRHKNNCRCDYCD